MKNEEKLDVTQEVVATPEVTTETIETPSDEVVTEVTAEEKEEEVNEPLLTAEQKEAIEQEMKKLRKIPDAMRMQEERSLKDFELVTLRSGIIGHIVRMYSRKAISDVYNYATSTNKTLQDLVLEIEEKKSPLSSMTRNMLKEESKVGRLNFLAIAVLVPSGIVVDTVLPEEVSEIEDVVEVTE